MTLSRILSSTPEGRRNLATAGLRGDILELLHDALEARGTSRTELAQLLGRSKAAISNTLGGDGNLRLNTIAEYLDALDMELEVRAVPREVREIEPPCILAIGDVTSGEAGPREPIFDPKTQRITAGRLTVGEITEFWQDKPAAESRTGSWASSTDCVAMSATSFCVSVTTLGSVKSE